MRVGHESESQSKEKESAKSCVHRGPRNCVPQPRAGPMTAANAKVEDWEMVDGIFEDERGNARIQVGSMNGDPVMLSGMSHAGFFLRWFSLHHLTPLFPPGTRR
jgi:hypothetical protein